MSFQKNKKAKDRKYLDYIKTLDCCCCLESGCDPHHIKSPYSNGDDYHTIPLCRKHHTEFHSAGKDMWEEKWGNQAELMLKIQSVAISEGRL